MTEETKQRRKEKKLSFLCLTASQALGRLLLSSKFLSNDNFAIPYLPFIYNRFSSLPDNIRAIGTVPRYICQHSTNLPLSVYIYISLEARYYYSELDVSDLKPKPIRIVRPKVPFFFFFYFQPIVPPFRPLCL